jgi:hypothetical protein
MGILPPSDRSVLEKFAADRHCAGRGRRLRRDFDELSRVAQSSRFSRAVNEGRSL